MAAVTVVALATVLLLGVGEAGAQGCAMCKTAIGGPGDPLARGINASIFFMMAMPFALFAAVGGWLAYAFWRGGREARSEAGESVDFENMQANREGAR